MNARQEIANRIDGIEMPLQWKGLRLVHEETWVSDPYNTRRSAKRALGREQRTHTPQGGWHKEGEGIHNCDGKWYAFRRQGYYA